MSLAPDAIFDQIAAWNKAQSDFYRDNPREDALPTWDDLDAEGKLEHRSVCPDYCGLCDGHREWGICSGCTHLDAEAVDGATTCCNQPLAALAGDERAEARWLAA